MQQSGIYDNDFHNIDLQLNNIEHYEIHHDKIQQNTLNMIMTFSRVVTHRIMTFSNVAM
jgi:hypothetical protein